jgi:hypothetical protein
MNTQVKAGRNAPHDEVDFLWDDCDLDAVVDALTTLERVAEARARRQCGDLPLGDADADLENFDVDAFIGLKYQ